MHMQHKYGLQKGRSMLEMIGVLAIIGVLSIGGLNVFQKAMSRYRINQTQDFVSMLKFAYMETCGTSDTCTYNRTVASGYLDKEFQKLTDSSGHGWNNFPIIPNGQWSTYQQKNGGSWGKNILNIGFLRIPSNFCVELVNTNWKDIKMLRVDNVIESVLTGDISTKMEMLKQACFQKERVQMGLFFDMTNP